MAQVSTTMPTADFYPLHSVAAILMISHTLLAVRPIETRPTTTGVELAGGMEQRLLATDTVVKTSSAVMQQFTTERGLCTMFPAYMERFRAQLLPPV